MIFITLGSQKFQFNRLLTAVDGLVENRKIKEEVFGQIGNSDYIPENFESRRFLDHKEFECMMNRADVVITHGGTGAIMSAIKKGKKVIAIPRLAKYGEHVDDHQIEIVGEFKNLDLICECNDIENLSDALDKVTTHEYKKYESNTQRILDNIEKFIDLI